MVPLSHIAYGGAVLDRLSKKLLLESVQHPSAELLDQAARLFAAGLRGEGLEGTTAFAEKRKPAWAT